MSNLKKILNSKKNCKSVWFMRQAGRYLPEFRKIRSNNTNFIELCLNSKLSSEITLQPIGCKVISELNLLFKQSSIKLVLFDLIFRNSGKYRPACLINQTDLQFFLEFRIFLRLLIK